MQGQGDTHDDVYDEKEKNLLFNKAIFEYLRLSLGTCDDEWPGSNTVTRIHSSDSVNSERLFTLQILIVCLCVL